MEQFGNRLIDILAELKKDPRANREAALKKLKAEIATIQKLKEETNGFRHELDAAYQKYLEKGLAVETARETARK